MKSKIRLEAISCLMISNVNLSLVTMDKILDIALSKGAFEVYIDNSDNEIKILAVDSKFKDIISTLQAEGVEFEEENK